MCYDVAAVPPFFGPPITAVASAGATALRAADGAEVRAFRALPEQASGVGVLVLPDIRGLAGFYETLTVRLAEQGHPAIAVDYYARGGITPAGIDADITAGITALADGGAAAVATLGFCYGGRQAFRTAAPRFGVAAAVGFYGYPEAIGGAPGPRQLAGGLTAPILGLWGGADAHIPTGMVEAFDAALTAAGCPHAFTTYPDAPHGFFDAAADEFADASADAWSRVRGFLSAVPVPWGRTALSST